jgi:hypothetical protein
MPWFRLDDGFYDNPKVTRAGNPAIGLWVRAATWSAKHLTDGHIPDHIMRGLGTQAQAAQLEAIRMVVHVNDEYIIPDWLDYNLSAEQIRAERKAARERQAKRRRNEQNGQYE